MSEGVNCGHTSAEHAELLRKLTRKNLSSADIAYIEAATELAVLAELESDVLSKLGGSDEQAKVRA